jgi:hypothetical protein
MIDPLSKEWQAIEAWAEQKKKETQEALTICIPHDDSTYKRGYYAAIVELLSLVEKRNFIDEKPYHI